MTGSERPTGGWQPKVGDKFDCTYESGCTVVTEPNEDGDFEGIDSDGIQCVCTVYA